MKKLIKLLVIVLGVVSYSSIEAQQMPTTNHYTLDKYRINSAYAGYNRCVEMYLSNMTQWMKVDGAPKTNHFSIQSGLGKNMGLGANFVIDRASIIQRISGNGSFAYQFNFGDDHHLRLGIGLGFYQVKIDPSNSIAIDANDDIILSGSQSGTTFNSEAGLFYTMKNLQLGLSVPQIVETQTKYEVAGLEGFSLKRHFVGYLGYNIKVGEKWNVTPSVLYKNISADVSQIDLNASVTYDDLITIGAGYRTHTGVVARLSLKLRDMVTLGYAYEIPGQSITSYSSGSHELILGIKLCKRKEEDIDLPLSDNLLADTIHDTVFKEISRIDTVYIYEHDTLEKVKEVSKEDRKVLDLAMHNLEFEFDDSKIKSQSIPYLDGLANVLNDRQDLKITMAGHTDDQGSANYNLNLSKSRVESVKAYLVSKGVKADRIATSHYGESKPLYDNSTIGGRIRNRRVEMEFVK